MRFDRFRRLCLALPEAEERETWGEATFRVRGRIFAMGGPGSVSVKASVDDQAGLIEMDPLTFGVSAYTGRFGWVSVRLDRLHAELAERIVENAWKLTAPRRLAAAYEEARKPASASRRPRRASRSGAGSPLR